MVTLAGYATRVSDMLVVFGEVARGRCVRAVHAAPLSTGFQVTFRDRQPVPQGEWLLIMSFVIRFLVFVWVCIYDPICECVINMCGSVI